MRYSHKTTIVPIVDDQFTRYDHNIICTVLPPDQIKVGIVEYLTNFGKLYYGILNKEKFKKLSRERLEFLLETIKKPQLTSDDCMNVGFNLYMMRHPNVGRWDLPCLLNDNILIRGNTRLWATGMIKSEPWLHVKFLEFRSHDDPESALVEPVEIVSTKQLHEIFNLAYQPTDIPNIELRLKEFIDQGSVKLKLHDITTREDQYTHSMSAGEPWVNGLLDWKEQYFPQPQIQIWTDWPELITDSSGIWDIKIIGPFAPYRELMTRPAHIEKCIYMENSNQQFSTHVLYVADSVKVDLGEVLMWLNTDHTVFMEENCSFVLYRPDKEYKTTFISVSKE